MCGFGVSCLVDSVWCSLVHMLPIAPVSRSVSRTISARTHLLFLSGVTGCIASPTQTGQDVPGGPVGAFVVGFDTIFSTGIGFFFFVEELEIV